MYSSQQGVLSYRGSNRYSVLGVGGGVFLSVLYVHSRNVNKKAPTGSLGGGDGSKLKQAIAVRIKAGWPYEAEQEILRRYLSHFALECLATGGFGGVCEKLLRALERYAEMIENIIKMYT